ncbi:MAG: NADH:flavin oxidoreductase/NADH oxidase family protein [Robiginitomaculum sp.]|nr:NADH:flavin oxidoreductase/NADH oxidase family protein [Robiginitomaculum sp.]MDQ7078463.1 NADH:flavin oxidoreductase/NADH oxidase family protein [Robiginitomaculum sp.]
MHDSILNEPLSLPCGAVLKNRLCKAAMTEGLADRYNRATKGHERLYRRWGAGGIGMMLTGNVQVDHRYLERPGNVVIEGEQSSEQLDALKRWSAAAKENGAAIWMQISHAGRQTMKYVASEPVGPSAVQVEMPGGMFGKPRALSADEITDIIGRFAHTARIAKETGFDGVQIHAAHGYLLSEFLNPLTNRREDEWGGALENRARLLRSVIAAVRQAVGADFPISVKLNSSDFQKGGFDFADSRQVAKWLREDGVDLLEISGGNYEQPVMMGTEGIEPVFEEGKRESTRAREGYFLDYAREMRAADTPPLMVTGGFRTRTGMETAIRDDGVAMIGLGRPLCVDTDAPAKLLGGAADHLTAWENILRIGPGWFGPQSKNNTLRMLNGWGIQAWFCLQLLRMGAGKAPNPRLGVFRAFLKYQSGEKKKAKALAW